MKSFKRVISFALSVLMVVTMLSTAVTSVFADATLDAELAALSKNVYIAENFNVTGGTSGWTITAQKPGVDVTVVTPDTFYLFNDFCVSYYANYNQGINGANGEEHYTSVGDLKFAINLGVMNTSTIKYKLYYGETLLATYDTGKTITGSNTGDVQNQLGTWSQNDLRIDITVKNDAVSVYTTRLGDITWTLEGGAGTTKNVALPSGYKFSNVPITYYRQGYSSTNSANSYAVYAIKSAKPGNGYTGKEALSINFPYDTVDAFNEYLGNVDISDEAAVAEATYIKNWACTGTSAALQAGLVAIGANSGAECSHSYTYTTTATCTQDGTRTYVCGLCGDSYTEAETAFGHDESTTVDNYLSTTVCNTCGETLDQTYLGRTSNYKVVSTDLDSKSVLAFDSVEYFVSSANNDKLVLGESWSDKTFSYTLNGTAVTGKINEITFVKDGQTVHTVDTAAGNDTYEFAAAGKYTVYGTLSDVTDADGATYDNQSVVLGSVVVRNYVVSEYTPRDVKILYGKNTDLGSIVEGDVTTNAFSLTVDGEEVTTLYYGDVIKCTGWWLDYKNYTFEHEGVVYNNGYIDYAAYYDAYTHEQIGAQAAYWQGNSANADVNGKTLSQTGEWYMLATVKSLNDAGNVVVNNVYIGSFKVKTYQGEIHSHDYVGTVEEEATCTTAGSKHYTCECGEDDYYTVIPALGHNYTATVTTEPTCSTAGEKTYTCSRCDDTYTEALEIVDHDYVDGYCRFCGIREEYTAEAAEWAMSFVDADGNAIESVDTVNGEFWMVVKLTNYADYIGEMNKVMNGSAVDTTNSTYDRTIAFATTLISMNGAEVMGVRDDNNKIIYTTPYEGATLITNFDSADGMLKIVFQSDNNAGCTYSVGKTDLDANDGELFRIKLTSKLDTVGSFNIKFAETSDVVASSVALVNKPTAGEWELGTSYASELAFDARGYDTIYTMDVIEYVEPEPVGPTYVEALAVDKKNVVFESDYTIWLTVAKDVYESYETVTMVISKDLYTNKDTTGAVTGSSESTVTATGYNNSAKGYYFEYAGLAAKEIATNVTATVYAVDAEGNEYYGPEFEYSLRTYAENQINKANANANFKVMMVDFLNYGTAAQKYFVYNINDLANKNIDAFQNLATAERTLLNNKAGTEDSSYEAQISNFNLIFDNKVVIVAALSDAKFDDAKKAAVEDSWYAQITYKGIAGDDRSATIYLNDEESFAKQGKYWCVLFDGLAAKEMSTIVTIAIYNGDGEQVSNSVTYSIESYAAGKTNSSTANMPELVKAMMKFGDSDKYYFENK